LAGCDAFLASGRIACRPAVARRLAMAPLGAAGGDGEQEPLLLRAAKGQEVERVPVWMMRQAGRHMQAYRELVQDHPTFRERSEVPDLSFEISMQPYRRYHVDGVILFSDILTPLPGMNVEFDILEKAGPVIREPYRSQERVDTITKIDPAKACPFVGEVLTRLRAEVGNSATVLGFVGLPFTLATYLVEGKSSQEYLEIKKLAHNEPKVLHQMLQILAENIGDYACYMADSGAQVIQIFDSWAATLSPRDYDEFCLPYQKIVVQRLKAKHPDLPIIMYIKNSGALLERMAQSGVDMISVDWTVSLDDAKKRLDAVRPGIGVQGNLDPAILLSQNPALIKERTEEILAMGGGQGHVMNLGHGIEAATSEESTAFFVDTVKAWRP